MASTAPRNDETFDVRSLASSNPSSGAFADYEDLSSARLADSDVQHQASLRSHHPDLTITALPASNVDLLRFAANGKASAELDITTESILRWRGYVPPLGWSGTGHLGETTFFAKYHYQWSGEHYILYTIGPRFQQMQYLLKEPGRGESVSSSCAKSDALIMDAGESLKDDVANFVWVFDLYWKQSRELWNEVQKASWDKVILDHSMKKELQSVSESFFDSKDVYDRFGVPWKRGLIFHGPPGNGKTISIKALMKTLYLRKDPIPTLYVKSAPETYNLASVFAQARLMSPCLLVLEDIETIVTSKTRSYFFNEVDGLAGNSGIMMLASTNYLDRLDPGLSKRPSRFDRKFNFPKPNEAERTQYAEFWRAKLEKAGSDVPFPKKLCPEMAHITNDFSFAYMQEAFIATMLIIARDQTDPAGLNRCADDPSSGESQNNDDDDDDDDLHKYRLWRVFKNQVSSLRKDMDSGDDEMVGRYRAAGTEQFGSAFPALPPIPPLPAWMQPRPDQMTRALAASSSGGLPSSLLPGPPPADILGAEGVSPPAAALGMDKSTAFARTAFELIP